MKRFISILFFLFCAATVSCQKDTIRHSTDSIANRVYLLQRIERNGEVLPEVNIKEVTVVGHPESIKSSWYRRYDRMVYNLKKVYPYAMIVRDKLYEVNQDLAAIPDERERRKYIRNVEKDVFGEYEDDMRNLTITQGRLLLKLIDRETRNTSYDLIKEYRGGLSAAFWQGIARIFGTNLKDEYDAYGEDALIEIILLQIESGEL